MSKKPNFITILMDDMGWTDLSYAGSDFYESPNIDALSDFYSCFFTISRT